MKKLILLMVAVMMVCISNAQYSFTASFSSSGACNSGLGAAVWYRTAESMCNHHNSTTYSSCAECRQAREAFLSNSGSAYGCTIHFNATPCNPCGSTGGGNGQASGEADVLGLSQGTSFFSSNPANEVRDWADDNEELMTRIGGVEPVKHGIVMDNGYVFSADMPGTISKFVLDDDPEIYGARDGVHVPDGFFDRPLQLDTRNDFCSEDFAMIKTDQLKPVEFIPEEIEKTVNYDKWFDVAGEVVKLGVNLALLSQMPTALLADVTINLVVEDIKVAYKLSQNQYVGNNGEIFGMIIYNTINKSAQDAIFMITASGMGKVFGKPATKVAEQVGMNIVGTSVSINSILINADE